MNTIQRFKIPSGTPFVVRELGYCMLKGCSAIYIFPPHARYPVKVTQQDQADFFDEIRQLLSIIPWERCNANIVVGVELTKGFQSIPGFLNCVPHGELSRNIRSRLMMMGQMKSESCATEIELSFDLGLFDTIELVSPMDLRIFERAIINRYYKQTRDYRHCKSMNEYLPAHF